MMRVKDEARWIRRSVKSILPICDQVFVLDDHSSDGTPDICASLPGVTVIPSQSSILDECSDKNHLLNIVRTFNPEYVICIDGDEVLVGADKLLEAMRGTDATSISMRIPYLWDREDQIRMDGVYGEYRRHSAFRPRNFVYVSDTPGGFHCGNVPRRAMLHAITIDTRLLHFGYLHAEDRARKYAWYSAQDPCNIVEDCYRHIAAGLNTPHQRLVEMQEQFRLESGLPELHPFEILPPAPKATDRTMHAGPMKLEALCTTHP